MFMLLGGVNVFAQEEDVTHYIANAGFDEDVSFNADGSTKEIISKDVSLSDRSWAWIAADSTVYARPKSTSSQSRPDGRKEEAVNGFNARIKGWQIETATTFPACEWVYFGSVPYDLAEKSVPIADDGSDYLQVPKKPEVANGDDNKAFVYLRAGWTNSCTYKQVVNLPCAQYRLEYWSININPNSTAEATNLSKVTCRKDVFEEEEGGLSAKEWTKHEIEFTPTSEFTIEFGYKSANSTSANNPWICIDGIKLYKIGDADPEDLLRADLADEIDELITMAEDLPISNYEGLINDILDRASAAEDAEGEEELTQAVKDLKALKQQVEELKVTITEYEALKADADRLMDAENHYPGLAAFETALEEIEQGVQEATVAEFAGYVEKLQKALNDYNLSQPATADNPADYTFLIQSPYFTNKVAAPTITYNADGTIAEVVYPNEADYTAGSAPEDSNSEGWTIVTSGGDQRLNYVQGRVCWNAWRQGSTDVAVAQELTGIPNGYYTVSAEMITQASYLSNQHVYANSNIQSAESPVLTEGAWNDDNTGAWTYLTTEKVLVIDGKLTIGALGSALNGSTDQTGWFCVTNFQLKYYGAATDEEIAAAYDARVAEYTALAEQIHFAADKAAYKTALDKLGAASTLEEMNANLDAVAEAATEAKASVAKYEGVITGTYNDLKEAVDYSNNQKAIATKAVELMDALMNAADATYTTMDDNTTILRKYRDGYLPALGDAENTEFNDAVCKEALKSAINGQVSQLTAITALPTTAKLDEYIESLSLALSKLAGADVIMSGESNVTALIVNPTIEASSTTVVPNGWNVEMEGSGNNYITNSGQGVDGNGSNRYLDAWNGTASALLYTASQTIENIPNGTYEVKAMMRATGTPGAEGVYLFAIDGTEMDNALFAAAHIVPTPIAAYGLEPTEDEIASGATVRYATDTYGEIWMDAYDKLYKDGIETDEIQDIVGANGSQGRGWFYKSIQIEVTNNVLTLGVTTDSTKTVGHKDLDGAECVPFSGTWLSADNFTLTILENKQKDYNPATGIVATEPQEALEPKVAAIYSVSGARLNSLQKGINLVKMADGTVQKVLVK